MKSCLGYLACTSIQFTGLNIFISLFEGTHCAESEYVIMSNNLANNQPIFSMDVFILKKKQLVSSQLNYQLLIK